MTDEDIIRNRASIQAQRDSRAIRGSLLRAIFRHRLWMWIERLRKPRPA